MIETNPHPAKNRGARVMIANHQSALDLMVGAALSSEGCLVVAKKEIIWIPFINLSWWALGFTRLDRSNPTRAINSLLELSRFIVQDQRSIWIMPEGTRYPAGEIGPFKKGAFHLAIQAQVPIYPVVLSGSGELLGKAGFFPKPGKIWIRFLPPVPTVGLSSHDVETLMNQVRTQMQQEYQTLQSQTKKEQEVVPLLQRF
ncbi:MAG: lysophospholipid acyltransferase family protein [Bdellovibrionia bacterium]